MEKREYGKNKELLSVIGFAGIIVMNEEQKDANDYVAEAIDQDINYFDVAPSYGNAEEKLGPALKGKRDSIFLACKTGKRTAKEAELELYESLEKLKTDYFDLYQMHAVTNMEDVNILTGTGGCLEFFVKAKEKGIIRHIGFSAHSQEAAISLMDLYNFESVLFPYNWVNVNVSGFGKKILAKATEKGVTKLALKAMALTKWEEGEEKNYPKCWYKPIDDPTLASLALRFTLSEDISAAVTPGDIRLFRIAMDAVKNLRPLNEVEKEYLKNRSKDFKPIF